MNLDIIAGGMKAIQVLNKGVAKRDKIVLLSRQGSVPSLDFTLLAQRLRERMPGVEVTICSTDPETVDKGAFARSIFTMSREVAESRVCVVEDYIPSVSVAELDDKTQVIQLWHALGAIKKFGYQSLGTPAGRTWEEARKLHMHGNYDWVVAGGPGAIPAFKRAFGYPESRIVPLGMPRIDYLLDPDPHSAFHRASGRILAAHEELRSGASLVMYMPTLRKAAEGGDWMTGEISRLAQALRPYGARLVVSGHPLDAGWDPGLLERYDNLVSVTGEASCDLLGLADAVVTDYSAVAFEAGLLGVPTYFYVPDIDEYRLSPGLNIDPLQSFPDCAFAQPEPLAESILGEGRPDENSFAAFCRNYFRGIGFGATDRICELVAQAFEKSKTGRGVDLAKIEGVSERPKRPGTPWAFQVYESLRPLLEDRAFAFGDTCVGAIFYQGFYPGMHELSLAATRDDFDLLRGPVAMLAREAGWFVRGADDRELGYLRITPGPCAMDDPREVFSFYPLDQVPHQSILRFKMLAEARATRAGDISRMQRLKRYRGLDTGVVARLFGDNRSQGVMGERTIQQRTIAVSSIFPLRDAGFEGGKIQLPSNVSSWTSEPTAARERVTEVIQRDGLESLEEVKRVSAQLGTRFFLVGGSLLGAVRHRGFIPWDDDLDIGMLRGDYERFVNEGQELLAPGYFIQLPSTDPHIHFVYARLRHRGVDYLTLYNEHKDFDKSLWVDVFPFDAAPDNRYLARLQRTAARSFARASMGFKRRREYALEDMRDPHPLLEKDARYLRCYAALAPWFPVRACEFLYHAAAECFNPALAGKEGTRYASFIPSYTVFEPGDIDDVRWVDFEGHEMPIPQGAEAFLSRQYGDYLALPPVHERQTDHGFLRLELEDGTTMSA